MSDCLFCKIISGEIPSKKIYEDENVYAFYDINPAAPVHFLVIPKVHIPSADIVTAENSAAVAAVFEAIPKIAKQLKIENNYRVLNNCGESVGQSVFHLHFHVISGSEIMRERLI